MKGMHDTRAVADLMARAEAFHPPSPLAVRISGLDLVALLRSDG
jgi:hypothetical protein